MYYLFLDFSLLSGYGLYFESMKTTALLILSLLFIGNIYCQEAGFEWASSIGSSDVEANRSMDIDNDGNIYHTGFYFEDFDFDPGPGVHELTHVGGIDCYITKLNSDGGFEWAISIAGPNNDQGFDVICSESDNIYVTGYFQGTVDFDPSDAVHEVTAEGGEDCFILKLDANGNFLWVSILGDGSDDNGKVITVDSDENIYISGFYKGTVDFDPGPDFFDITAEGEEDVFIQKLDSEGNFIWAKSIGGEDKDDVEAICIDAFNNVYIGGNFEGTSDFDPSDDVVTFTAAGYFDDYIVKLNSDGIFEWALTVGGVLGDELIDLAVDSDGDLYSTGFFNSTIDVDPGMGVLEFNPSGSSDLFIQKLDTDGNLIWAKQTGDVDQEVVYGFDLDELNNVYTTGYFVGTTDFNPNAGVFNITSEGAGDCFIQKLDQDGEFIWAKALGGSGSDRGSAISLHSSGDIYLTGEFENTVDFNPGAEEYNLESEGSRDIFVLKLNACSPDAVTDEITACISYTWTDGVTYYEDNNSATQNLLNIDGCDSIVTLDLTINEVDITTTAIGGVITSNETGAVYRWLDCNNDYSEIDGESSVNYTPTEDGDYAVEVTVGECVDTSECVSIDGVGVYEEALLDNITIYPNPNNGLVNIDLRHIQDATVKVYSANGSLVYQVNDIANQFYSFELDVQSGIYFVETQTSLGLRQFKLIVE